jgi:hypothetical protein
MYKKVNTPSVLTPPIHFLPHLTKTLICIQPFPSVILQHQSCNPPPFSPPPSHWPPPACPLSPPPPSPNVKPSLVTSASTAAPVARSHGWKTPFFSRETSALATLTPGLTAASTSRPTDSLVLVSWPADGRDIINGKGMGERIVLTTTVRLFVNPVCNGFAQGNYIDVAPGQTGCFAGKINSYSFL